MTNKRTVRSILLAFCLLTLQAAVQADTLVIGQVAPASGKTAFAGRDYSDGIQLYFNQINTTGGINGHQLKLVRLDDGGVPDETVKLTKKLVAEEKPLALIGYIGTEGLRALARDEILKKERIPLIGMRSGEQRVEPYFYNIRASLKEEVTRIARQVALNTADPRIALLYDLGFVDPEAVKMVEETFAQANLKFVSKQEFKKESADVTTVANALSAAKAKSALLLLDGSSTASFVEHFSLSPNPPQLLLTSETDIEVLMQRLGNEQARGIIISQVLPNPYSATRRLTREFNLAASKATGSATRISYTSLEGYIAAKVLVEAIRRAGSKVNRANLTTALDGLGEFDLGGYVVEFQPGKREGSRFVELSVINKNGKLTQ